MLGYTKRIPINDPDVRKQMIVTSENLDYLWREVQRLSKKLKEIEDSKNSNKTLLNQVRKEVFG